jgi:hypothetical protein
MDQVARDMRFTTDELVRIARWESIAPGFDRDEATVVVHIQPILDHLRSDGTIVCRVVQDGGTANYFGFIVHEAVVAHAQSESRKDPMPSGRPCVAVYLSLMAPFGVFGHTTFLDGDDFFALDRLGPEQVVEPKTCRTKMEKAVVKAVRDASRYELLVREDIQALLPEGVEPFEYCFCGEPWDRVFHILFANSD